MIFLYGIKVLITKKLWVRVSFFIYLIKIKNKVILVCASFKLKKLLIILVCASFKLKEFFLEEIY
jgi:hypothetical protein